MHAANLTGLVSLRHLMIAALLLLPLLTLWNLAIAAYAPKLIVAFGPRLRGVTEAREPIDWSLKALADGSLQRAISDAITEANPARPLLIRFSNSSRKRLFGIYGAPGVIEGADGHLIEKPYLDEYCSRDLDALRERASTWIPKLKELQDFYEARGKTFLYVITPSKVAHLPEKFISLVHCPSREQDRREHLPLYNRMLTEAGVRVLDLASLTHGLKGRYEVDLFPMGGVHWNQLGVAHAVDRLIVDLNRLKGPDFARRLAWTYEITDRPKGEDTDLFDLVNLMFARPRYSTPVVHYRMKRPCSEFGSASTKVALIGGSFTGEFGRVLLEEGCLLRLERYNYLYRSFHAGPGMKTVRKNLKPGDIEPVRDYDLVILEENEMLIGASRHAPEFHRVILGR
ncbi:MAG: alginate O-acetyltransferase [Bradyrhizobiaceae bacterium]|nr:alginate O-acetyltransferase [Bradyrhizobiaceae bacterium]